ncbi:MAG: carbon starvation protein A [Deltaproteobacteria bacterium]|nr:MAG: carbon starvation protein A [Deltaproteobacteria bacterium]
MTRALRNFAWVAISLAGAGALAVIATARGEAISSAWFLIAALCIYALGFRFYSGFLARRVFALDDARATPAHRLRDGKDFVPTHRWVVFGHHFAAIAGPGPLVGPILAAQFGYLPGTLYIVIGVVIGGAVQDFTILVGSLRRGGKSLGQMVREEIGSLGGAAALVGVLAIMIILIGVLALIVVNAMFGSPWATSTVAATIPIAIGMGLYMTLLRPGRVLEATLLGVALVVLAVFAGRWVDESAALRVFFDLDKKTLALSLIGYGFLASVLPVWLLLAPRDYLSAFIKIGTVAMLAAGLLAVHPPVQLPALTQFIDGSGPVFAGKLFPFCFITIACGAISGFHSLIASGTTPKLLDRESDARMVGYGAMLMESFVGIMALLSAAVMEPGVYFAINSPAALIGTTVQSAATAVSGWGYVLAPDAFETLTREVGEHSLLSRTGGAPSLAVGMAEIFSRALGGEAVKALWYHFAIMFEALFILTTLDAGTRVGRFMVQDLLGSAWRPLGQTSSLPANVLASGLIVAGWGYFLYQGVVDPLGGINSLWPLFGIANQLLASTALALATTILIKSARPAFAFTTIVPLSWLLSVTMTAGSQKIWNPDRRIGFLAQADYLAGQLAQGLVPAEKLAETRVLIFNNRLDAAITGVFMALVAIVVLDAARVWWNTLRPGGAAPDAIAIPVDAVPTPASVSSALRSLRQFARGFTGLVPLRADSSSVRNALERRASARKSCC